MENSAKLTPDELLKWRKKFRELSNSARYAEAYRLAVKMNKRYPKEIIFSYYEALMTAEDSVNFTPRQVDARYKIAAKKFRKLLYRIRAVEPALRTNIRNEYYWFSRQPLKQYRLGVQGVAEGKKSFYYPQGVGAAQLAKKYALQGRKALSRRWAIKSEKAWLNYFKVVPNWYNSYLFYAMALGYQDKLPEMDKALMKGAKIAGKGKNWKTVRHYRNEILETLAKRG